MNKTHTIIAVGLFGVLALGVGFGVRSSQKQNVGSQITTTVSQVTAGNAPVTHLKIATTSLPEPANVNSAIPEAQVLGVTAVNTNVTITTPPTTAKKKPAAKPKAVVKKPAPKNTNTAKPPATSGTSLNVEITFYGSYDNDPAGSRDISHPVIHSQAGGTGTYADPMTFASPTGPGAYPVGAIIYVPSVQKYFIKEDTCATSWTAPNGCGAVSHVDLYIGNPSDSKAVLACENTLTPDGNAKIILNPPSNLTYDPTPMWNQATGVCMKPH